MIGIALLIYGCLAVGVVVVHVALLRLGFWRSLRAELLEKLTHHQDEPILLHAQGDTAHRADAMRELRDVHLVEAHCPRFRQYDGCCLKGASNETTYLKAHCF